MKVKDIERTANVAWSPKPHNPILLAVGTAAQQLDASFNTNAALEIYSLNLAEPGPDMLQKSALPSDHRFHKIVWGSVGASDAGTIIGGCDAGLMQIYDAGKLLAGDGGALMSQQKKHSGPVHALDFNPFQQNLFATGSSESEIFIWDLNNTSGAMTPGAKSQPLEDVLSISWNQQVQHILASTFASKCVIWDLRKNEPIIKLTDTVSRVRWKVVAWHPEVATQLCLASEEDHSPIIQLWDLRFATSPLKTMENHQRGVLSVAWCRDDPDLFVSCAKDNRILAWNPNSQQPNGEVLSEVAKTNQWNFDVQWCPKNPALIACPSFDGHVQIYSLMGGKTQKVQTTNKIADSFPGMDGYAEAPAQQENILQVCNDLTKPPKWLKRPVGATFGFGGKLVSFVAPTGETGTEGRSVQISQVITEAEFVQKSTELEQALDEGNFSEYCRTKADTTDDQHKKYIWHFIRANFEENPRTELLNLLGYRIEDVNNKLNQRIGLKKPPSPINNDPFDAIVAEKPKKAPFKIKTGNDSDGLITQALLLGNVEAAVDLCLKAKRFADAIIIAMTGGSDLLARTQHAYLEQCDGYVSSLISALVSEDWTSIINNCDLSSWKEALAATLTHASDDVLPNLAEELGNRLVLETDAQLRKDSQLCYICSGSFDSLVNSWTGSISTSTRDLQELVELVVFLQKSIERQGRQVNISGRLAELLIQYASLLASQGNLATALSYLGSTNGKQSENVESLRERLYVTLGVKPMYAKQVAPAALGRRQSHQRTSFTLSQQATAAASVVAAPARPESVGGVGLPGRKYVLDPSVASTNAYGQVPAFNNNVYGTPAPFQQQQTPFGGNNNYVASSMPFGQHQQQPQQQQQVQPPPLLPPFGEIATERSFGGQRGVTQSGWNDPPAVGKTMKTQAREDLTSPPAITHPIYGSAPIQQPLLPNNNGYDPTYSNQINTGVGGMPPPPPPTSSTLPNNYGLVSSNANVPPPQIFQPTLPPTTTPTPSNLMQQPIGNNGYNGGGFHFKQNAVNFNPVQQQQSLQQQQNQRVVQEKAPKEPIPEEHVHMQTVFDELKFQCSCAANNPQTKRKLEDVGRKLEALYDLLREHKLSSNTLTSLHQLVQLVQHGDYAGGLNLHTQLVSGPDFAQIASFMPGLKVLLQCALQLQVYLR